MREDTATMIAGAAAGAAARVPLHPIDTCKAKLQVQVRTVAAAKAAPFSSLPAALLSVGRTEGLRGLYRGFVGSVIGAVPAACLYFTVYEATKKQLQSHPTVAAMPSLTHFVGGFAAESVSCVLWVPIDVVKERLQVQSSLAGAFKYSGAVDAVSTIVRSQGLWGLYRGYGATLLSFGPFSALYFVFYEHAKSFASRTFEASGDHDGLGFASFLACGASAGSAASFLTNPLDMAKMRLQVQRSGAETPFAYRNIFDGVFQIAKNEGFLALFRGSGARIAYHAPSTAIAFSLMERIKKALTD
jgi:hypothetical protein